MFPECEFCGCLWTEENKVYWGEDPYAADINDDHTEHYICEECADKFAQDI